MAGSTRGLDDGDAPSSRRPRAPTITIDTTAVVSDPTPAAQEAESAPAHQVSASTARSPGGLSADEGLSPSTNPEPMAGGFPITPQRTLSGSRLDIPAAPAAASVAGSPAVKDTRPTSPVSVPSPVASRGNDRNGQAFLSVPTNYRSRQNSVDSDDGSRSFVSSQGETMVGSVSYKSRKSISSHLSENERIMNDQDALRPDPGQEEDFDVPNNPFAFSPGMLRKMFDPKSLAAFYKLGGLDGLERGLRTDRKAGLSIDEDHLDGTVSYEEVVPRSGTMGKHIDEPEEEHHQQQQQQEEYHQQQQQQQQQHVVTHTSSSHTGRIPLSPRRRSSGAEHYVDRKRVFKDNRLPEKKGKSFLQLMWVTYNDKVLILLSVAAVVSLAIGLYQTFGQHHDPGHPAVEWVEGVAIIVAIVIVVLVGSLNDYQKERQFAKLNKRKQDRLVKAIRSGKTQEISVFDVLVGDVLLLEPGDMIPADGVLIEGFNIRCDEAQATGESDIIKKRPADEVFAAIQNHEDLKHMDPFVQSGARVMEGMGTFLVTATGVYSSYGKTLMSLNDDPEITPLQSKLNIIAEYIAKLGGASGLLLFVVLFIEFLVRLPKMHDLSPAEKGQQFLNIFIVVVTIIVVAVPEGLPLAVTLALAFATTRMLRDNNLVRHLKACEVMGNATTICSDKTGTLTQNKMQVVAGTIGSSHRFGSAVAPSGSSGGDPTTTTTTTPASPSGHDVTPQEMVATLSPSVKELLLKSISLNSTAFEGEIDGEKTFIGSKTETALLLFAKDFLAMGPVSEERANAHILQLYPFDSGRKCMGVVVRLPSGRTRLYVKGASEIMLERCAQIVRDPSQELAACTLTDDNRETLRKLIEAYASNSLRTIGLIYRDFERWPPRNLRSHSGGGDKDEIPFDEICKYMVFAGLVGIKDPLRPGVPQAVKDCQKAGVVVRMVTGDNRLTAQAIAQDCGILQEHSLVMEGPVFRKLSRREQEEILPRLHVLARSSPEDKRILVRRLKDMGETVAVTGDGTNDAPALKLADVGFSMGIAGTEVAKEASAIILMDDNFNSIVKALMWGRAVNDAVKRFLQFQLTVNITAVVLTFVSAVSSSSESSVLTAVQLLWVNLIMDTLAALALATDPPQPSVLDRKPERKGSSIISTTMWKMIIGQAIYQLLITFLIYFGSPGILPAYDPVVDDSEIQTLVFNTFVWMQIFNQWNNRRLDNHFNIFEGLTKNYFFLGISAIVCGGQVLIVMVGGRAFSISPHKQTPAMWGYAIVLGFLSIPVGVIIRLIPDSLLERLVPEFVKRRARSKVPGVTVSGEEEGGAGAYDSLYPSPLADVRDQLAFLKRVKGGRVNNLRFAMKHPRETFLPRYKSPSGSRDHSRSNSINVRPSQQQLPPPQTPTREDSFGGHSTHGGAGGGAATPDSSSRHRSRSMRSRSNSALGAATVMTGIVAGSIAAGWSPIERRPEPSAEGGFLGGGVPKRSGSHSQDNKQQQQQQQQQEQQQQPSMLSDRGLTDEPQEVEEGFLGNPAMDVPMLRLPSPSPSHHRDSTPSHDS